MRELQDTVPAGPLHCGLCRPSNGCRPRLPLPPLFVGKPENGVVFSDGIESDYLNFNAGTVLTVGVASDHGQLVVH